MMCARMCVCVCVSVYSMGLLVGPFLHRLWRKTAWLDAGTARNITQNGLYGSWGALRRSRSGTPYAAEIRYVGLRPFAGFVVWPELF